MSWIKTTLNGIIDQLFANAPSEPNKTNGTLHRNVLKQAFDEFILMVEDNIYLKTSIDTVINGINSAISTLQSASHTHANKAILDLITEDNLDTRNKGYFATALDLTTAHPT